MHSTTSTARHYIIRGGIIACTEIKTTDHSTGESVGGTSVSRPRSDSVNPRRFLISCFRSVRVPCLSRTSRVRAVRAASLHPAFVMSVHSEALAPKASVQMLEKQQQTGSVQSVQVSGPIARSTRASIQVDHPQRPPRIPDDAEERRLLAAQ